MSVNALTWILLLATASADDGDVCQGEQCAANAEVLLQVRQGTNRSSVDNDVEEEANPWEKTMHKFSDQICQPFTGGTCGFWGCDGSRNAQCKKYSFYKFCVCAPGQCAFQGKCIDAKDFKPNPKYADYAVKHVGDKLCQPFTGGTCMTSGCSESRDATCEKKLLCLCGKGKCAMNGKCVDEATFFGKVADTTTEKAKEKSADTADKTIADAKSGEACEAAATPDGPGKNCPDNVDSSTCINGNKGYSSLKEAWDECGKVDECGAVMRFKNGQYYLRRASDPDRPAGDGTQCFAYTCKDDHE